MSKDNDIPSGTGQETPAQAANAPAGPRKPPRRSRREAASALASFTVYAGQRFVRDGCPQRASGLTFTSLLAMVPLLAVSFAIFSAFPAFDKLKGKAQSYIFENFVPQVGTEVQAYLEGFTAKTGQLSAVGVVFLAVTAIMLLMTISNTFNSIWNVDRAKGLFSRMLVFWAVLTLAPLLFGASFSIYSVLVGLASSSGAEGAVSGLTKLAFVVPFLLQAAGLTVLYLAMPNFPVRRRDAVIGGLFAAALLELLKRGFALYVTSFPTYQTIYGVMATIPIFLMWVYLGWMVVLVGAEVTASLPEWRAGARRILKRGLSPVQRLAAALAVLQALGRAARAGEALSDRRLSGLSRVGPEALTDATTTLLRHNYVTRTDRNHWVLCRDLETVSLAALYSDLGLSLDTDIPRVHLQSAWGQRFAQVIGRAEAGNRDVMGLPLKVLLAPPDVGEDPLPDDDALDDGEVSRLSFNGRVLALIGLGTLGQAG